MELALGTVQFGLEYGVSNETGKIDKSSIIEILEAAKGKVKYLDTANVYGNSEEILGQLSECTSNFEIITKTAHIDNSTNEPGYLVDIEKSFHQSLNKLKRDNVDTLLVHNVNDLLSERSDDLYELLLKLQNQGFVNKVGVSVYSASEAVDLSAKYSIQSVQFPINVLNQTFDNSGALKKLYKQGIELHARSIYCQGLLLMQTDKLNPYFNSIKPVFNKYQEMLANNNLSLTEGALGYIKQIDKIDCMVFGVENKSQLLETLALLGSESPSIDYSPYAITDESIINPSLWKL